MRRKHSERNQAEANVNSKRPSPQLAFALTWCTHASVCVYSASLHSTFYTLLSAVCATDRLFQCSTAPVPYCATALSASVYTPTVCNTRCAFSSRVLVDERWCALLFSYCFFTHLPLHCLSAALCLHSTASTRFFPREYVMLTW